MKRPIPEAPSRPERMDIPSPWGPLPTFLGIGAQRSGTTWLDRQLRSHPGACLSGRRKEVRFFDLHYDRGEAWYRSFFRNCGETAGAIGEISPDYLFDPRAPERIAHLLPHCRLLILLRHPVDRAYSQYAREVQSFDERRSFPQFVREETDVLARGRYGEQVERYLRWVRREQMLVIAYERIAVEPLAVRAEVAAFLGIDPQGFVADPHERVNAAFRPARPEAYASAKRLGGWLRRAGFDAVVEWAKGAGIRRAFGSRGGLASLDEQLRASIYSEFEADVARLEALLSMDLRCWWDDVSPPQPATGTGPVASA